MHHWRYLQSVGRYKLSSIISDTEDSVTEVCTQYHFEVSITQVSYPAYLFIENMVVMEAALNVPRALSQTGNSD